MATQLYSDKVVLGGSDEPLRVASALVEIEATHITAVRELVRADLGPLTNGNERLDLGSRLIAPAFVNAHTHLALCALRGIETAIADRLNVVEELYFKVERFLLPGDVRAFARMGAWESVLSGVGTVWEHYYHGGQLAEALLDVGLTGVVAPTVQDVDGPGVPDVESQLEATVALAEDARLHDAGIYAAAGPHATDTVSSDLWRRVRELADEYDLIIHSHVAQSVEEFERSLERHGCSPVERLAREGTLDAGAGALLVHALFVTSPDIEKLDPGRHVLGHCPFSQAQFDFPCRLEPWMEHGIKVAVGTDCAACNDSMNVQKELRLMAGSAGFQTTHSRTLSRFYHTGGLEEAREVHRHRNRAVAATQHLREARFLLSTIWAVPGGFDPRLKVGEVRTGRRANLSIWDLEHPACWPANDPFRTLSMTNATGALHGLMVNGRWAAEPGNHARSVLESDAYRDSQREADERLDALLRRAGLKG